MKKYNKPQMMAKNAPTGSYAAGCPAERDNGGRNNSSSYLCRKCDRAM